MKTDRTKIAFFLATSGHSGVDRAMRNLIPELAKKKYAVDLLRVRNHGPDIPSSIPGVTIRETKHKHVYSSFIFLCTYLKTHKPDILFTDKDRVNRVSLLAKMISKVDTRAVVSLGTTISKSLDDRRFFERHIQRLSIKHLYPLAYSFIVSSQGIAEDIEQYMGKNFNNLRVVPRPVVSHDMFLKEFPIPDHEWFRDKNKPLILGVGELSYRKDFATLLKAFSLACKQTPCRLMILGEGKCRSQLQALAKDLSIQENLALPGFVHDPYPYMAHADLIALSSRREGLGFVLIEGLALGTPVVSTNCPSGPHEILQGGKYGPLVPVGDHASMAEAIVQTLFNPVPKIKLQQAAKPYELQSSTEAYLQAMGLAPSP